MSPGLSSWLFPADPFATHFEQDLDEGEVEGLEKVLSAPLEYQHSKVRGHDVPVEEDGGREGEWQSLAALISPFLS